MVTNEQLDALEAQVNAYYMESEKISFQIEDHQEELEGIAKAYEGLNDVSAQVLRQYFLKGGGQA